MTDEELDLARAREAAASCSTYTPQVVVAQIAARLAREGWMPIDPDLLEARKMLAERMPDQAEAARGGRHDDGRVIGFLLAGIKRGRELEREK